MSDLTLFRDHARAMSTAEHRPDCEGTPEIIAKREKGRRSYHWLFREDDMPSNLAPITPCAGCVTQADRVLWVRLADETDAYLARNVDEGLFA